MKVLLFYFLAEHEFNNTDSDLQTAIYLLTIPR